jgi:tRNA pseudouridine13 synthase
MKIKRAPEDFQVEEILDAKILAEILPAPMVGAASAAHQGATEVATTPAVGTASAAQEAATPAPFVLYRLHKTGLATPEAAAALARHWKLPPGALAYAGLKDKHSQSSQHVTVRCGPHFEPAPEAAEGPGWRVERLGWLARPIATADIAGNRFRIVVREMTAEDSADMEKAARLLACGVAPSVAQAVSLRPASEGHAAQADSLRYEALRFVNYFGDQRFGSARHGQGFLAKQLIRGEFEAALKLAIAAPARKDRREQKEFKRAVAEGWGRWREMLPRLRRCPERRAIERLAEAGGDFRGAFRALPYFFQQLCVYAYQSYLWNAVARRLVAERCAPLGPVLQAEDLFGTMLFPAAGGVPEGFADLNVPLLGHKTELREPWAAAARAVLAEEGIATAQLKIPKMRRPFFGEEPRRLFAEARGFELSAPKADGPVGRRRGTRTVTFDLPRGAYATVLLRALGQ